MNYLANLLRKLCGGNSRRAVLETGSEARPDSDAANALEAAALVAAGNEALTQNATAQAIELFAAALRLQHDHADAHRGMGLAHLRRNELDDAADSLQMAVHFRPDFAEVVVLKIWGGLTFDEIAGTLGINGSTAASRYRYGLRDLQRVLEGGGQPLRTIRS